MASPVRPRIQSADEGGRKSRRHSRIFQLRHRRHALGRGKTFYCWISSNLVPWIETFLRERKADIPLLVNFFLGKFAKKLGKDLRGVSQKAMESLVNYSWPGNIRELQNVIERAVVLAGGPILNLDDSMIQSNDSAQPSALVTLENVERGHIVRALEETRWVIHGKKGAAEILGINASTLLSRMDKLGIKKPRSD